MVKRRLQIILVKIKKIGTIENQIKKRKHFKKMLAELRKESTLIQKVIGGSILMLLLINQAY